MITSGISIPTAGLSAADEYDRKADEFAALAEAASTAEDCICYRDMERDCRLKAEAERASEITQLLHRTTGRNVHYV